METEKKYALLIDADNVSPKYMDLVLRETKTLGDVSIRRIYGDWTEIGKHSWKECLLENSLTPIQQYSYTTGKNASDSAMIIDAMDILYTREIDGFVIVSSDSDFTKLAMRLRESGKYVVGMGESKTPSPFVKACDRFKTLDILMRSVEEIPKKGRNVGKSYYKRENNNIAEQSTEKEKNEADISPITDLREIKTAIFFSDFMHRVHIVSCRQSAAIYSRRSFPTLPPGCAILQHSAKSPLMMKQAEKGYCATFICAAMQTAVTFR